MTRSTPTPRPDASPPNRGQGVRRAAPPSSSESGGQGMPNLDDLRSQSSYKPPEPPAHIRSNLAPICTDCYEPTGTTDPQFSTARDLPRNETGEPGEDLGSKNFNWSAPLVSLPGRAGHDLGLTLFFNSLVW